MSKNPSPRFVLVVDDEPSVRTSLRRYLERSGYRVRAGRSVAEALQALGPDLQAAILDVILVSSGGQSGLDILAAIRRMPGGSEIPVLMFTGYGLNAEVLSAIKEHHAELMPKPVPLQTIVEWLRKKIGSPHDPDAS